MDIIARARKLPSAPPPNDDPAQIKGNMTLEMKRLGASIFAWHIANYPGSHVFGHDALANLKFAEVCIRRVGMGGQHVLVREDEDPEELRKISLESQTVCELTVDEGMLNVHGMLAGGCSAHLVDVGTFSSLLMLSLITGINANGVSTSMNIVWHGGAPHGTELRMVSTTLSMGGAIIAARAEVYDKRTSKLLISASHTIAPFKASEKAKPKPKL